MWFSCNHGEFFPSIWIAKNYKKKGFKVVISGLVDELFSGY